jgi:hypothetical protein
MKYSTAEAGKAHIRLKAVFVLMFMELGKLQRIQKSKPQVERQPTNQLKLNLTI